MRKRKKRPAVDVVLLLILTLVTGTTPVPVSAQTLLDKPREPAVIFNKLNLSFTIPDLFIPSHDLPIRFSRTYTSDVIRGASSALGLGWTHSFGVRLEFEEESVLNPERAIFTDEAGRRYGFERRLDGSYITPPVLQATLEEDLHRTNYTLAFKNRTKYFFNKEGRLEWIRTPSNNTLTLGYGERNQLQSVASSAGARMDFLYDAQGHLAQVKDSAGRVTRYFQDEQGRLIKAVDWRGAETSYGYDAENRLSSITDALGRTAAFTYSAIGDLTSVTDPAGHTTRYDFIRSGWWYTEKGPEDYFPNRVTVTDPLGNKSIAEYNDLGSPLMLQDKEGNRTFFQYDERGNLTGMLDPEHGRTELVWDENSNLISITNSLRDRAELLYDGQDRLIEVKDPKGRVTEYVYDKDGHLTEIRNPEGGITRLAYTPTGNLSTYQDANGHGTSFTTNAIGQVTAVTDARDNTVTYRYNERYELSSISNPLGQEKRIVNDPAGRRKKILYPDGKEALYTYDPAGRLIRAESPEGTIQVEYDTLDRPIQVTDADGKTIRYDYDALGRRTRMIDQAGNETRYAYDKRDNLVELARSDGTVIAFEYDKVNRRTAVIFPNRVKASYRYDPSGNVLEIRYERMQAGPVLASPEALPAGQAGATQSIISRTRYYYDELGNCVSKREGLSGLEPDLLPSRETTYAYDKLSRLIEVKEPDGTTTAYTYDPAGNRLTREVVPGLRPGTTHEKEASTYNELNQLVTQGATSFEYDPAGNLVARKEGDKTTRYSYDSNNLLISVSSFVRPELVEGRTLATYTYDPLGRRISKSTQEGTLRYAYDAEDAHLELGPENQPTRTYIHGPGIDDLLGAVVPDTKEAEYFLSDRLGSIIAVLDQAGRQKETFTYGPFGEVTASVLARPEGPKQFLLPHFTGRELDPETGFYYYRNRYYAPTQGRFTTPDPIGLLGGANLYAYVHNNPVNWVDPYGLFGFGGTAGETATAGAGAAGTGETASAGGGIFFGNGKVSLGGYGSFGWFFGGPWFGWGFPSNRGNTSVGAYGGVGGGLFITNAGQVRDLELTQTTYSFDLGLPGIFIKGSLQISVGGGIWIATLTGGRGGGAAFTKVGTQTISKEIWSWQGNLELPGGNPGVPEPSTLALAGLGVATLAAYYRRRRRKGGER